LTRIPFGSEEYYNYDLREPKRKIINPDKIRETHKTVVSTNDWSNIPYYPTNREKRENVAKYLMSMGKQVPDSLIRQIEEDKQKEIQTDSFNNFTSNSQQEKRVHFQDQQHLQQQHFQQQHLQQQHFQQQQQQHFQQKQQPPPNKFSPQYASYINAKPRAQASAKIRLGGVFN
jgi:hypothetical protein